MKKPLFLIVEAIDTMSIWSGRLLAGFIFVMAFVICYEVVARYFFDSPTTWAIELATMIFGVYMVGGGIWALYNKTHVKMDIFYSKWTMRGRAFADVCTFPFFLAFFGVIFWKAAEYGVESVQRLEHSNTAWGPPIYHWKMTLSIAVFFVILQGLGDFIRNLYLVATGKEL